MKRPRPPQPGALAFQIEGTLAWPRVKELVIAGNKRRCIMFRRTVTRVGVPAVVVAVLLMAGPAWAQPYGGDSASAGASSGGASARALEVILKASGVPNRNGQVAWPSAFRL